MTVDDFVSIFHGGAVRAWLDWSQILSDPFRVSEVYTRSRPLLGDLYTVWYAKPNGEPGDWRSPQDRLLKVHEARSAMTSWPDDRNERVTRFRRQFASQNEPVQLVLPCYDVGSGDHILLDGNHRAVAAHEQGCDVRLMLFVVHGPVTADVLPDLGRFALAASDSATESR